jgi:hypothetical protein
MNPKQNMSKYEELTLISGILTIVAFSFLIQHVYATKITDNLTYFWIFLNFTGQFLLFVYGTINNIFGIYFTALILMIGISYVVYVKIAYKKNKKNTFINK